MADNTTLNAGTGGDVIASDDIGGVKYQRVKPSWGVDGAAVDTSALAPMPVEPYGDRVPYWPSYGAPDATEKVGAGVDSGGALSTRGAVLTDEGTYRVNFANTSLAVALGTVTVSGKIVTGTGFLTTDVHLKDYFKLDADAETAWLQIASIDSNTQLTLYSSYVGGLSGAASRSLVQPTTGAGGSIAVASGQCTLTSGITSGSRTLIARSVDYGPLVFRQRSSISQRVANQNARIGLVESSATPRYFARFRLTGTDANTVVTCESARNPTTAPSVAETESTQVTVPNGLTTASMLDYRVEQLTEVVRFYINGVLVAEHSRSMPSAYDFMTSDVLIENTAIPASSTSIVVDYSTVKNHNKLEVGVMSDAERIVAAEPPAETRTFSQAGVIAINTDLMVIDCTQIRGLSIQCASLGVSGVITPAWSNDGVNYVNASLFTQAGSFATVVAASTVNVTNVFGKYLRLRLTTATTSGTTSLNVVLSQSTSSAPPVLATQGVSGSVSISGSVTTAAITGALPSGTAAIGDTGTQYRANATGAASGAHIVSAAGTNATIVKASAGRLIGWSLGNTTAVWQYVKFYNQATTPTVGTGVVRTVAIPPGISREMQLPGGIAFATGIGMSITTGSPDADATATTLGAVVGDVFFA